MLVCPYCQTRPSPGNPALHDRRYACQCLRLSCEDFGPGRRFDWWYQTDLYGDYSAMNVEDDGSFFYTDGVQRMDMLPEGGLFRERYVDSLVAHSLAASVLES